MGKRSRGRRGQRRRNTTASETGSDTRGFRDTATEWGKTILLTAVFLVVIRTLLVQTFVIVSGSMEDTFLVGDFVMVNRLALGTRVPGTEVLTPGYSTPAVGTC